MGVITRMRNQKAVYWSLGTGSVKYDDFGQPINTSIPIEIACRWDGSQTEFIDTEGTKRLSQGVVYVDRKVDIGGHLFEGTLSDLIHPSDPNKNPGAFEIKQFTTTPNFKATETLLTAFVV